MADNLLKQAIADAKAVKEVAIANAKLSLEETFKPHLSSLISRRLREELTEDNDASSEIGGAGLTVDDPAPKEPSAATSDSSHIENPGQEVDTLGEGLDDDELNLDDDPVDMTGGAHPIDMGGDDLGDAPAGDDLGLGADAGAGALDVPPAAPAPEIDGTPTGAPDAGADPLAGGDDLGLGDEFGAEDGDDDLDLEALIRELEADVGDDDEIAPDADMAGAYAEPKLEQFDDVNAGAKANGAITKPLNVKENAEGVFTDGKSPAAVDGVNGGKKVTPGQEVTGTAAETMKEEFDLEEILREIEAEDAVAEQQSAIASENVNLKKSLREHRDVIHFLRGKLQEVNMLNAKLLYTNKLFKTFNMSAGQKLNIVETFDRATTVREVKLVYATLAESFKHKPAVKKSVRNITEGMASAPVGGTKSKNAAVLTEGNEMVARFQKLANIKKQ